jgi:hypothetical protein
VNTYRNTPLWRAYTTLAGYLDRTAGWDRMPTPPGLAVLIGLRTALRRHNLHDTSTLPSTGGPEPGPPSAEMRVSRTTDGSHNDLEQPAMGMAGSRFGRNIALEALADESASEVLTPNPREVSRALMTRTSLAPATSVNSLVAAWLQFMIRDWFSHGTSPTDRPWEVSLADDDPWPERPMLIPRTPDDPTRPPGSTGPQTRINVLTHWWDGSQIYGVNAAEQAFVRSGYRGTLRVLDDGRLPLPDDPGLDPSRVPGFWIGTEMLRTLFTREHNAVCSRLAAAYPTWDDEALFQRARLVVAALLAKLHTVEWTPAVISHPTTVTALRANWFGLAGERIHRLLGRISGSEAISGIPGSHSDHYGVPFALTEEFVAVYRMHPLIRDDWSVRSARDDSPMHDYAFGELAGPRGLKVLDDIPMADLLYSFGTLPPGLVELHNFPRALQEFERPDGRRQDLAATDILRSRELGVPRYNAFRRALRLTPAATFEDLTDNREWADEIRRVYDGDIEKVDLVVGMYAERKPRGFAFSDTAFRIFILMASRRLNSDRFFTDYFTPQVYTPEGLDWIADNTMASVLLRHHPELRPALAGVENAFAPWRTTSGR